MKSTHEWIKFRQFQNVEVSVSVSYPKRFTSIRIYFSLTRKKIYIQLQTLSVDQWITEEKLSQASHLNNASAFQPSSLPHTTYWRTPKLEINIHYLIQVSHISFPFSSILHSSMILPCPMQHHMEDHSHHFN